MRQIRTSINELDNNNGSGGIEILIPGALGNPNDVIPTPIFLEYYEGKVMLRVWNGKDDPDVSIEIKLKETTNA